MTKRALKRLTRETAFDALAFEEDATVRRLPLNRGWSPVAFEDREVQIAVQRGLAAHANDVFTFGLFEGAIRHLHRSLAEALEIVP